MSATTSATVLDVISITRLGDVTPSQLSATGEPLSSMAPLQAENSSVSFFPRHALLHNHPTLLRVDHIHDQVKDAPPTPAETSTQVHSPAYSDTLFSGMSSTLLTEEYCPHHNVTGTDASTSDHDEFVFSSLQEHSAEIGKTTDSDFERQASECQAQRTSDFNFSPGGTHMTHGRSSNESLVPSNECSENLVNHVDPEPAQGSQNIGESAPKGHRDTTLVIISSASQPSFDTLSDQHAQSDSHDQQLGYIAEENNLDLPDFTDADIDYYGLPSSSPLQEPISAPPTSSPPIFTFSPCLSSQGSLSSIPDFKFDNKCGIVSNGELGLVLGLGETSLSEYDSTHRMSCSTPLEEVPISLPSVTSLPSSLPFSSPVSCPRQGSVQEISSPAWASTPPQLPSSASHPPSTTSPLQAQGCLPTTASQLLLTKVPSKHPSQHGPVAVESPKAPKPSLDEVSLPSPKLADKSKAETGDLDGVIVTTTDVKPKPKNTTISRVTTTPAPRRSTFASQNKAFKKLITPFRSPVMKETKMEDSVRPQLPSVTGKAFSTTRKLVSAPPSTVNSVNLSTERQRCSEKEKEKVVIVDKKKHRTARAAAQFKSPLTAAAAASVGNSSIRLTPTVQILERKVQLLRRAVKVKADREEKVLKDLIKIWAEAGREVSYELFELAKDREGNVNSWSGGGVRKFEDSWGWSTREGTKRPKTEDQAGTWGWDTSTSNMVEGQEEDVDLDEEPPAKDDYEEEKSEATIGTMLRQLGVDPVILGWSDEEATFVDN